MMHLMRLTSFTLLLTIPVAASLAQSSSSATVGGPDSITDQIMERRHRLDQYLKLMKDPNPATRLAAIQQALKDSDPLVRGGAISAYLKRFDALTPDINTDKSASIPPQELPRLAIKDIKWSDDAVSGLGYHATSCNGNYVARLQIAGGKLAIAYDGVCLRPSLLGIDNGGDDVKARKEAPAQCQLTLAPNSDDTLLEGSLRCVGMVTPLPVQLPFGP